MRVYCNIFFSLVLALVSGLFCASHAQTGFDLKIDKPEPYEERLLKAEKTGQKKMGRPKRFFQNLTTHYNYYFNANNKINEVIDGAKESFRDDYSILLPFYNYTLDATSQNSMELDSVIYKAQTGIVMHDLRNDWIDNMYLLWGAAWYFEKKFDSASLMFQFINYSFAEKEKDGYYKYIGSRMDGNNALSISTKENRSFPKNLSPAPSRNLAFIWQIRSQIEMGRLAEAGSLIATLKSDPLFPSRLRDDLEEVQAYWFYKQQVWDSAANHLVLALDQAKNKTERARWEYLAAQLFEKSKRYEEAQGLYEKSIKHTTDPIMDIYARLNLVRLNKDGSDNYVDKNIEELLKMARRDKYTDYRDVIYYMAAQMEMEQNHFEEARILLEKASKYNNGNLASRNKSYLQIADLSYDQKKYLQAARFYDSIQTADLNEKELARVDERKAALVKVVLNSGIISRQDSLQAIAALSEEDRNSYLSKLLKQMLKAQGMDDRTITSGSASPVTASKALDLFSDNSKGDWYFYNNTLKTQGQQKFRQAWGNRPNADNWRRFSDVSQAAGKPVTPNRDGSGALATATPAASDGPSIESLLANVPMTPEAMTVSNDSVRNALFGLGMVYLTEVEDYNAAIENFEKIRQRFPRDGGMAEVLFQLHYAYKKAGDEAKAAEIKRLLTGTYPDSRFASILTTGKDPLAGASKSNTDATKAYEGVYDLFIEGRFDEALAAKQLADSVYKTTYWQPQLLYIEAVYHIRQRQDSVAKKVLQTLIAQGPETAMGKKAQTMIDVLNRRVQIETELAMMQITRPVEDSASTIAVIAPPKTIPSTPVVVPPVTNPPVDTVALRPMIRKESSVSVQPKKEVVIDKPISNPVSDTAAKKPIVAPKTVSAYRFEPGIKHSVLVILDKVDPMFVNEVKNAFVRYNKEKYYNQTIDANTIILDADRKILQLSGFANAQESIDYLQKAKKIAHLEIIPWLKSDKFSFSIASEANLNLLLEKKDLVQYRQFLDQNLPGKL